MNRREVTGMKVGDLKIFSLGFGASLPALPNSKGPGRQRTTPAGAALRDAHREIVLPRADDDSGGQDGGRPQILLVEEDRRFFELVEWILADGAPEFALVHAPRLSAALAVLTRQPIRLVLTDLRLPDSTGPATVRHLARAAPNVPLIVLSGVSDIEVALACVRDGAEELVVKQALDSEALIASARKTGRALVVDEGHQRYGASAELAAVIAEGAGSRRSRGGRATVPQGVGSDGSGHRGAGPPGRGAGHVAGR